MACRKDTSIRPIGIKGVNGNYLQRVGNINTLEGSYYQNMMTRGCNPNYKLRFPTYRDVTVDKGMADFQTFAKWCHQQKGFGEYGWFLDKDLLIPNNKVYSQDACVFIPHKVNGFLVNSYSKRRDTSLPLGVTWCESERKFKTYCSQLNGKNKTIGRFTCAKEAGIAYIEFKESLVPKLIEEYCDLVDPRVITALNNYSVVAHTRAGTSTHELYLNK